MKNLRAVLFLIVFSIQCIVATGQKRAELAPTPPMGWNSWNWFGKKDINEQTVREVIDAIVSTGLKEAGYNYVIVDGGWRDVKLDPEGRLVSHPVKFPLGIKALADYAHSKGLKFGVHVVPGTHDCGGDAVGGFNREELHVSQFVEWGLDFVKLDLCRQKADPCDHCEKNNSGWSEQTIRDTYSKWSRLLAGCGRDILFSISAYQFRDWNPEVCNMSRTTYDIQCRINKEGAVFDKPDRSNTNYLSVMAAAVNNDLSARYAGNGYWNDPDMMVTGNQGLSHSEQECHFALWCIMSSPLILGNDPRNMDEFERKLITNREAIAINQDPAEQGRLVKDEGNMQIWMKKLTNGKVAYLLLNTDPGKKTDLVLNLSSGKKAAIRDVLNNKNLGKFRKSVTQTLDPHSCSLLIVSY
ncbi:MAG TPA: glycoside hydrolase family 27 protein [Bacteroidales bacterium]|nr:glycoside hydrolase family 27 protein [Bacteroidales bacterium]